MLQVTVFRWNMDPLNLKFKGMRGTHTLSEAFCVSELARMCRIIQGTSEMILEQVSLLVHSVRKKTKVVRA